jgi:colicin import membrane protein
MKSVSSIFLDFDNQPRSFVVFFGLSFLSHIVIFALIVFVHIPNLSFRRITPPSAIQVDLVALNPDLPLSPPKGNKDSIETVKTIQQPVEQQQPEKQAEPPVKESAKKNINPSDFVIKEPGKPEPEVKKSLKKESINTKKVLENAVKQIEKQADASSPPTLANRLEKLKQEVKTDTRGLAYGSASETSGGQYRAGLTPIQIYQAEVSIRLKNNWVFSEKLAGATEGLESRLIIKILPDGNITDIWFEKRSGNEYLDNSAYKTIMKSNPLPPLPPGLSYYHLVLGFTPLGLDQ